MEYTVKEAAAILGKTANWIRRKAVGFLPVVVRKRKDGTRYKHTGAFVAGVLSADQYRREIRHSKHIIIINDSGLQTLQDHITQKELP